MASISLNQLFELARSLSPGGVLGRLTYPLRARWIAARYGTSQNAGPYEPLGSVVTWDADGRRVDLECSGGLLRLEALAPAVWRVRLRRLDAPPFEDEPFSYALDPGTEWPDAGRHDRLLVEKTDDEVIVHGGATTCRVQCTPCRLSFYDAGGQPLAEDIHGLGFRGHGAYATRRLAEAEAVYGLGERAFDLNLRGRSLSLWNRDPETYEPGDDPIHLSIPMLVGLRDGLAYGLFFDNPGRARIDLGQAHHDTLHYEVETGELCLYVLAGPGIADVLARYTHLTGRMPLPPLWALGYHQSRWSYYPEAEVRALAAQFRARHIPCDVIHLDIHYMDGYRVFTWDRDRFPDPPGMIADLREQGFRIVTILDPGVKTDPGYHVHDDGLARDAFCRLPDGALFHGPVWPGDCYFPDFTKPEVRDWWGGLYDSLLQAGVAGFWNDMNEPAIFGGTMPDAVCHDYEGRGARHGEVHNVYGLLMARASAEGVRRLLPDERVPVISRAGYAGLQRDALVWTGDNYATWEHMRLGISVCLNLGLSGVPFCGPDAGGFAGDCSGELLARWTQLGALTPFFRNHAALGTDRQEPWAFGEPWESICRRWIEFRYELLPYIYTAAWQAAETGLPMMRPLSLAFPGDRRTYSLADEYLFGDALLVAPVLGAGRTWRRVYLPGGEWYDFWTGVRASGSLEADAPLERLPLYVRSGTVLPMAPVVQHTGEWPPGVLTLHIYPGDGESWLYEDDGHSRAYRRGERRVIRFVSRVGDGNLVVRREVDGPYNPGYAHYQVAVHGLPKGPDSVLVDGQPVDVTYSADTRSALFSTAAWTELVVHGC
ncbi:MAG: DUF5110 domain-containing protein [Anaerolineae bacterium]|nr:DUF5110 domain-containing protein [Anaerolineae bacterium]